MKICIAQTHSLKGDIEKNISNHLQVIAYALKLNVDFIIFPELSISGYEPALAKEIVTTIDDSIFKPFQKISNDNSLYIGIGTPTQSSEGIHISMIIFRPNQKSLVYSKQQLHKDEQPFFVCGNKQIYPTIYGKKIAIGICYEALQEEHFLEAIENHAEIYIASVAKPKSGIKTANVYFPEMAKIHKTPILMCNSVGFCDNFLSVGKSAIWDKNGKLTGQLDSENEGILVYDTSLEITEIYQPINKSLSH